MHALLQHTPSAHDPLAQSVLAVHAAPFDLRTMHLVAEHPLPVVQSVSIAHVDEHAPALHVAYAPQLRVPCGAPELTVVQVPSLLGKSHAWHAEPHAPSQQ